MNKTISIKDSLVFGWNTFKSNWKFWLIVFFLAGMGSIGTSKGLSLSDTSTPDTDSSRLISYDTSRIGSVLGIESTRESSIPTPTLPEPSLGLLNPMFRIALIPFAVAGFAVAIFAALVSTTVKMGYINLVLDAARGKQVYYRTLLNQVSLRKAYRFLAATFLMGLLVAVGLVLFIIPGIYFALKYAFVGVALVDEDLKIGESFKRSAEITKGIKLRILWFAAIVAAASLIAIPLTFGLGIIVISIVSSIAMGHIYTSASEQSKVEA